MRSWYITRVDSFRPSVSGLSGRINMKMPGRTLHTREEGEGTGLNGAAQGAMPCTEN
jgi:hypothetical protein